MNLGVKPTLSRSGCRKLITNPAGFRGWRASLRLEFKRRFAPLRSEATALRFVASQARFAKELTQFHEIQPALLAAAGLSVKAASRLQDSEKKEVILGLITGFLEPAGVNFVEDLVFKFLLTRGDTLAGTMPNVGGVLAQRKLTRSVIACLRIGGRAYRWLDSRSGQWMDMPDDDTEVELTARGLNWKVNGRTRMLVSNVAVPIAGSHVDLCLLDCAPEALTKGIFESPAWYIALGELKGGIDPARADEHWRTARTSLSRVHEAFARNQLKPHTFFIGAAIEPKMASEIWTFLESGILENAANLTDENQIASITRWLCSL